MSQENIDDTFSKNMFGTEEVTVTVEYDGNGSEEEKKEEEKEEVKAEAPKEEEDEDKLNEEEERILENVKWVLRRECHLDWRRTSFVVFARKRTRSRSIRSERSIEKVVIKTGVLLFATNTLFN